jgi:hypothetical protein
MQRLLATALAATLALGTLAAPALADGHGHGHGHGHDHDRAGAHRTASHDGRGQNHEANRDEDGQGPHGCVNPAGNVRGWCKHNNNGTYNGNGNSNGYPNGNGGYANQQVSGIVTAVSGNRITILVGLRSINVDTSQAYRNGRSVNVGIGSSITAYGYYGSNNTFYATQIS